MKRSNKSYDRWKDKEFPTMLRKRTDNIKSGRVKGLTWDEVKEQVRANRKSNRQSLRADFLTYSTDKRQKRVARAYISTLHHLVEQWYGPLPSHVIEGLKESLKQVAEGKVTPYTGIDDMLML
jgi:hypothetical protein